MTFKKSAKESSSKDDNVPDIVRNNSWEDGDDSDNEENTQLNPKKQKSNSQQSFKTSSPSKPSKIDSILQTTVQFASSATHTDRGIKLLMYTLWLFSRLTTNHHHNPDLSPGLRKMYGDLSMVRYALRLYGLPLTIEGLHTGSWYTGWEDPRIKTLGKIMTWSMALYYPLEHVAYGNFVAPKLIKASGEKYTAWSCRAWGIFILGDLISSVLKIKELWRRRGEVERLRGRIGDDGEGLSEEEATQKDHDLKIQIKLNRLHIARCIFFLPPCAHWSYSKWMTEPILSENVVNGFCLAEAITCFYQSICSLRNK